MTRYAELGRAFEESVRKACEGKDVAVAFSGGMDSGLVAALAKKYARSVTCYTCGADGSFDVAAGMELAEILDLPWVQCRISEDTIEETVRQMISATKVSDPFTISYDLQLFTVCRASKEKIVLTGQGSDEYFMGCSRAVEPDDAEYERVKAWGVERLYKVSIPCEVAIASHFKQKLFYPYLDEEVLRLVSELDPSVLRPDNLQDRKLVLKEVAEGLGFPVLAHRTKKASQYGSGTTDLIRGAARKKGIRYNRFISDIYESLGLRNANLLRDTVVDVRMDPILLYDARAVLNACGLSDSEAVSLFYKRLVAEGNIDFLVEKR